jgi:hypothetical protein
VLVGPSRFVMIMKDGNMHRDPCDWLAAPQRIAAE